MKIKLIRKVKPVFVSVKVEHDLTFMRYKCPVCNNLINDDYVFCPYCANELDWNKRQNNTSYLKL